MDLNHQYAQHQLSIMRAGVATSRVSRTRHLAAAGLCAFRISNYQLDKGAVAAGGWLLKMDDLDRTAGAASDMYS